MMASSPLKSHGRQSGLTLIELMVGLLAGMLVVLAATGGVAFYESNRRNSMGGNSALENAIAAAYAIQFDARQAGFGSGIVLSNGTTTCASIATPLSITASPSATTSDSIAVAYYKDLSPATSACGSLYTVTYGVSSGNRFQATVGGVTEDIAENIVQMQAQYGISTGGTTVINKWVNTIGTEAPLAVRYVIVARSPQREKLTNGDLCASTSTSNQPTIAAPDTGFNIESGVDDTVTLNLGATGDWKCYSYKTVTLTVPLRNVINGINNVAAGS